MKWPWQESHAVDLACPRQGCGSFGGTPQSEIVIPRSDGSERKIGHVYGCPRCSILYGVIAGAVFVLGDKRKDVAPPPAPNGQSEMPPKDDPRRERLVRTDGDMPWRRS